EARRGRGAGKDDGRASEELHALEHHASGVQTRRQSEATAPRRIGEGPERAGAAAVPARRGRGGDEQPRHDPGRHGDDSRGSGTGGGVLGRDDGGAGAENQGAQGDGTEPRRDQAPGPSGLRATVVFGRFGGWLSTTGFAPSSPTSFWKSFSGSRATSS